MNHKIKKLLVANRGEIAHRIIQSARELSLETYAIYTPDDASHARLAHHAIPLSSPASYTDPQALVALCAARGIDTIHPGYGFLSESAELARACSANGIGLVGPGSSGATSTLLLERTADKLAARRLASECGVPVLPALQQATRDVPAVAQFAHQIGYPVMIKAVDGGGGRGIRLVEAEEMLEAACRRAIEESPSRLIFVEKAAVHGFLHVEVQIVADGRNVIHLYERQCSIQRRFQKVVEIAPAPSIDRRFIRRIIDSAMRIARRIEYVSIGTFEFLANPKTEEFYFLEINPRLQVEHTITETLCDVDLVHIQLLLAQGATLEEAGLSSVPLDPENPPSKYACQFRVTAEDVSKEWSISIGKLAKIMLPCGNGVRVDSALVPGQVIGSSFDSLLAKIIVYAPTWQRLVEKANRCLAETSIDGVETNLAILRGIAQHLEFGSVDCDTRWLERKQNELLRLGKSPRLANIDSTNAVSTSQLTSNSSLLGAPMLRRGDAWAVELESIGDTPSNLGLQHVSIDRILENNFPSTLRAEISFSNQAGKKQFKMSMNSTTASATAVTSRHRRGNPSNPRHVIIPFPGKLVEVMVDVGDVIKAEDVVCVIQQMKMEIEIRAKFGGRIAWVTDAADGEDVNEGLLAAELDLLDEKGASKL